MFYNTDGGNSNIYSDFPLFQTNPDMFCLYCTLYYNLAVHQTYNIL